MINIFAQLLDLIYKKRCYFCRSCAESVVMCSKCYTQIPLLAPQPIIFLDNIPVFSAGVYAKNIQKLIRAVKYHNQYELAHFQAKLMYDFWQKTENAGKYFVVVPVPLHKKRLKKRKYNHMSLVADEFAKMSGYEVREELITRVKDTKAQYKLTKEERQINLKDAFKADKSLYNGENLLVIDDILTTGSTLHEIIAEFRKNGIEKITCFTTSCTAAHL